MGIGGSGASAAAALAQARGLKVSGCDHYPFNEFTKPLNLGSDALLEGHSPDHLKSVDILAISPAIPSLDPNNAELLSAKEKGLEVLTWQEFMGKYLEEDRFVIAVCGTHGKSTTTAMVGLLLEEAGLDPTVELGAIVPKWGKNYRIGQGRYFVTEADEFNDNFLASTPDIAVVTTIEMDHPEYFKDFEAYKASFRKFLSQTKEKIIANLSDPGVSDILHHFKGQAFEIDYSSKLTTFPLQVPGQYNILNASAVYQVGKTLNINPEVIEKSLKSFTGIGRRFERMGEYKGAQVYSDFGHHPTEIKVTLQAAREKFPKSYIHVVFQPHMFSRTYALFDDFVRVLHNAPVNKISILDIYPSREVDAGLVTSKQLVKAINKTSITYEPDSERVLDQIKQTAKENEVIFFLGAGSTHDLANKLLDQNG